MGFAKYKILVVDDEENSRVCLGKLLTQAGYEATCVSSGHEALSYLEHHPVNIVLSDIRMPDMDGLSLLNEIHVHYPETRVVMVTAHGEVETYLEAVNLGASDFVHKPVRFNELKLVLEKLSITHALQLF
ncbi:response regulator [uncultured Desulfuromonas sp.]|uniref:response regulator n=1 Tax=uncultured Desulfuromonas sp. TaxID=181013 RepID=UPI002AAAA950|nr:response regulator [uncultured Desulfuromonas sp.]